MENGEDSGEESEVMAFPIVFQEMGDTQKNKKNDKFRLPES